MIVFSCPLITFPRVIYINVGSTTVLVGVARTKRQRGRGAGTVGFEKGPLGWVGRVSFER